MIRIWVEPKGKQFRGHVKFPDGEHFITVPARKTPELAAKVAATILAEHMILDLSDGVVYEITEADENAG